MEHDNSLTVAARDYEIVRRNLDYLRDHWREQPSLDLLAERNGLSAAHLQRLADAGPGRLHDLFVTHEGMTPGAYKARGRGLTIHYGFHDCPFGKALLMVADQGICGLAFADEGQEEASFLDMRRRWPEAEYVENTEATTGPVTRIFNPGHWAAERPLRIVFIGTEFETQVWQTLLKIPMGQATTYSDIAGHIGHSKASRAVGAAVGRNPISFVVPCHRVLGKSGSLCGYHWGLTRKQAILGWEAGLLAGGGRLPEVSG